MEYLMTYGWSILVLGVVVAVLFSLGVFNGGSGSAGSGVCVPISGYQCTKPVLYSSGVLSATIAQIGQTITITGTACSSNSTTAPSLFNSIIPSVTLASGTVATLNFSCAGAVGQVGKTFTGAIWIRYTTCATCQPVKQLVSKIKVPVVSASSGPTVGAVAYVPITITNTNTVSGTGSNFQQMISFSPTSYTSNEASDLGNIRFTQNGATLYSWCESGCTSSSSNAVFWILIPGGIGFNAGGTANVVVNMTFVSNVVEYDGSVAGESPTQSSSYAQYDNGNSIFSFYDNFAGGTVNPGYTKDQSSGMTISQTDGLTLTTASPASEGGLIWSTGFSAPMIFDSYVTAVSGVVAGSMIQNGNLGSSSGYGFSYWGGSAAIGSMDGGFPGPYDIPNLQITTGIMGQAWIATGSEAYYKNYAVWTSSDSSLTWPSTQYVSIGIYFSSPDSSITYQWIRTRTYPPGGVMPTTSLGAISH